MLAALNPLSRSGLKNPLDVKGLSSYPHRFNSILP
jgi:hypothetical protein